MGKLEELKKFEKLKNLKKLKPYAYTTKKAVPITWNSLQTNQNTYIIQF